MRKYDDRLFLVAFILGVLGELLYLSLAAPSWIAVVAASLLIGLFVAGVKTETKVIPIYIAFLCVVMIITGTVFSLALL